MYWCAQLLPEILKNVQRELFWVDFQLKQFYFCIVVFCVLSWMKWDVVTACYLHAELWRQRPLSLVSDCTLLLFSDTWAFGSWKNWLVGIAGWTAQPACGESWEGYALPWSADNTLLPGEPVCREIALCSQSFISAVLEPTNLYFNLDCSPSAQKR